MSVKPRWKIAVPSKEAPLLAQKLNVSSLLADLLIQRGYTDEAEASEFLSPKLQSLSDPFSLTDLKEATQRVVQAIEKKEQIVVFGDYDVDGITSTTMLHLALSKVGAKVHPFLPHREKEGYGLTLSAIKRCLEETSPSLLIAVDCGTTSVKEIAHLSKQGVEVIVIDHHELPPTLPENTLLVNPHRDGRLEYLCTAGLVFKFLHGLLKTQESYRSHIDLKKYLDLAAVGTISDLVPLKKENRVVVKHGLAQLRYTENLGLKALSRVARTRETPQSDDVSFRLAPRINASGRLHSAMDSLKLLISDDSNEAKSFALLLDESNTERRSLEANILKEAMEMLEKSFNPDEDYCVVLGERGWHVGVVGIVASRILRTYYRPTFIIAFNEKGEGKGSGRNISSGKNLVEGLAASKEILLGFGGHKMAAGLSIHEDNLEQFRKEINAWAKKTLSKEDLQPVLHLAGRMKAEEVTSEILREIEMIAPFGRDNPKPLFGFHDLHLARPPQYVGKEGEHLKLFFKTSGNKPLEAIGFGMVEKAEGILEGDFEIAGSIEWNDFSNSLQIQMVDIRSVKN